MHFAFQELDAAPRLAWYARLRAGSPEVTVLHGPWVETRDDAFFEAAWDGSYEEGRLDAATVVAGTGARATSDAVVFVAPTHAHDRLYTVRTRDELWVSNSLVFVLVQAGDEPDPRHTAYASDLLEQAIAGIRRERRTLPTRRGEVSLHECANLVVTPDLALRREEKPAPPEPRDFDEYLALLDGAIGRVLHNATDPRRRHPFTPLATLSSGYDALAVAAIAARHGCKEAVTFAEMEPGVPAASDSGEAIGARLGMHVTSHARYAYRSLPGPVEAEFCVFPPGGDVVLASLEDRLRGSVLLTGRYGGGLWATGTRRLPPDLGHGALRIRMGGFAMGEFRLRVGFLGFLPCAIGWQHAAAIQRITGSEAMRPWTLGTAYDRPIPRRILEEAGVPRGAFGQRKRAGAGHPIHGPDDLVPESRADYLRFVRELRPPRGAVLRMHLLHGARRALARVVCLRARLAPRDPDPLAISPAHDSGDPSQLSRLFRMTLGLRRTTSPFLLHWGFDRTRGRYPGPADEPFDGA